MRETRERITRMAETGAAGSGASRRLEPRLDERIRAALQSRLAMVIALAIVFGLLWWSAVARDVSAERLLSLAVWGVMLGGIIALGSIGLTLIYGVLRFPNFSHGALVTLGAYLGFAFMKALPGGEPLRPFSFGWEFLAALVLAMPLVGVVALGIDRVIYRPLRNRKASLVLFVMASLAMAFFVRSIIYLVWGSDFRFYYSRGKTRRSTCRSASACRPTSSSSSASAS